MEALALARKAKEALLAKKGGDLVILDVRGLSSITDYYLIGTGNSGPHLKALLNEVERTLDGEGIARHRKAGTAESGWMVLDYFDVVVHIFSPHMRGYYALEQLWNDAKRVE